MRILIRTGIGGASGMGHAVRMRALARELADRGATIGFLDTPALTDFVAPFPCLANLHSMRSFGTVETIIFDNTVHPGVQHNTTFARFCKAGLRVVRIDHPYATPETCTLLVLPTLHTLPATLSYLRASFGDRLLAGADYVLLDQEVTAQPPIPYAGRMNGPIVFCAGGSDPDDVLGTMAQWCGSLVKTTEWVFLLPDMPSGLSIQYPWVTYQPFDRAWLRKASLVVTTMGVTVYECLYYDTPTLVVGHTDQHCVAAEALWQRYFPSVLWCDIQRMGQAHFVDLLTDIQHGLGLPSPDKRMQKTNGLLDGKGVERVAQKILGLA
mgnify:CR=1 FL=1